MDFIGSLRTYLSLYLSGNALSYFILLYFIFDLATSEIADQSTLTPN